MKYRSILALLRGISPRARTPTQALALFPTYTVGVWPPTADQFPLHNLLLDSMMPALSLKGMVYIANIVS